MLKESANLMEEQIQIRRERAEKQNFDIRNIGKKPIYSEFEVANPLTGGKYKVAIRGFSPGDNYCSCPDFRKNTLGTCKHIEAVMRCLREQVSEKKLAGEFVPRITEVYLHYSDDLTIKITQAMGASRKLKTVIDKYFTKAGILRKGMIRRFPSFISRIEKMDDRVVIYRDVMEYIEKEIDLLEGAVEEKKYMKQVEKGDFGKELLKAELYPYQQEGVVFASCRRRCVIGDDMGLGKTIQAIGAAQVLINNKGIEKMLIICPASLKHQWKEEIERFSDNEATVLEGNMLVRKRLYESEIQGFLITTYEAVRRDVKEVNAWAPDLIILDEAQRIKNWETKTAQAMKSLKSPYAFVLTGTPMENKIDELFSIVEFVDDRRLGPAFKFLSDHTVYEEESKTRIIGYKDLDKIRKNLSPIMLRRSKAEVLIQLPERTDNLCFVPMTPEQAAPYNEQQEIVARIVAKWRRQKFLNEFDHRRLMCAMANMRMLCDSTYLFDKETNFSPKLDELRQIVGEIIEEGRKIVIFSQWTRMLEKVGELLKELGVGYVYLHGGVPSKKRGVLIRAFMEEKEVKVFLSSDAGGVGLNLQAGATVINVDLPWNPAVLEQRIGRVHRMGQKRNVHVINMITKGSIEERIFHIIQDKKALFDGVFEGTTDSVDFKASSGKIFKELVDNMTEEMGTPPIADEIDEPEEASDIIEPEGGVSSVVPELSPENMKAFFNVGKDILVALTGALSGTASTGDNHGAAKILTDEQTGRRQLHLDLPPDDVLKSSLRTAGQFLMNLGNL